MWGKGELAPRAIPEIRGICQLDLNLGTWNPIQMPAQPGSLQHDPSGFSVQTALVGG